MSVVLDATALDSGHRTRGIGRYVQGLVQGFAALHRHGELDDLPLRLLRIAGVQPTDEDRALPFERVDYKRIIRRGASEMHIENRLTLDRALPPDTVMYHATAMEGCSQRYPWVATCHDLIPVLLRGSYLRPWAVKERAFWSGYMRRLREDARLVIAISDHTRRTLIETAGVPDDRIRVVHHGLTPFWFEAADCAGVSGTVRRAAERPFVLFVGGFDARKNFATLLAGLAMIPSTQRPRLLVAGHRTPTIRRRHGRIRGLRRLEASFFEYVSDEDLRFLYSRAVCLAFPSREEGWGFPIVEAMAVGTPVVCAAHGSMVEAAGGAAITCNVSRAEDIAHSIRALVESDDARSTAIEAGRTRARALTWEQCAREVAAVYREALGG